MPTGAFEHGASITRYILPLGIVLLVVIWRNSRARRLKIERLWLLPVIYIGLLAASLAAAPPQVTPLSVVLLVGGFAIGSAIGWQRARFTRIHIHPETHDLTSRASPIGLVFIFAILLLRIAGRDFLAQYAAALHVPIVAIGDAFMAMAVAMLATQRLALWIRASRMLAEATAASASVNSPL